MTLCVAWKYNDFYALATDSRISVGDNISDAGVKLFQIPIRIRKLSFDVNEMETVYTSSIGVTYSGSNLSGYLAIERLAVCLYNLEFSQNISSLSLDFIAELFRILLEETISELKSLKAFTEIDLMFIGKCPATNKSRAFRFNASDSGVSQSEILSNSGFDYWVIGSGEYKFRMFMDDALREPIRVHHKVLEVFQWVIDGRRIESVGGPIQYGHITSDGFFERFGVYQHETDDTLLGMNIFSVISRMNNGLGIIYNSIDRS